MHCLCKSPCGDPDCLQGCYLNKRNKQMNTQETQAMNDLLDTLLRKLGLAKTCGAYHRGTNKKTINKLVLQINTLYKLCGVNHSIKG